MIAIGLISIPNPRPAALYLSALLFRTWLMVPVHIFPSLGHMLLEPIALLLCAKLSAVFNTSPFLTCRFLGPLSKAVFVLFWRPHPNRQCSLQVFFNSTDHTSPLCDLRPRHSAFWLPLRCHHFLALFFILCALSTFIPTTTMSPLVFWPFAAGGCVFLLFTWPWGSPCMLGLSASLRHYF